MGTIIMTVVFTVFIYRTISVRVRNIPLKDFFNFKKYKP